MIQTSFYFLGAIFFLACIVERSSLIYLAFLKIQKATNGGFSQLKLVRELRQAILEKTSLVADKATREDIRKAVMDAADLQKLERLNQRLSVYLEKQQKEPVNA